MIEQVKKRSGKIVPFEKLRIERAMEKAFIATGVDYRDDLLSKISIDVVNFLNVVFNEHKTPSVEEIQDVVEKKLIEHGFLSVAKSYIIYRKEHEQLREKQLNELLQKIEKSDLRVKKR